MHNFRNLILSAVLMCFGLLSFAQDDDKVSQNLVTNGDFEKVETRTLKKLGGLDEFVEGWFSATHENADIFSRETRSEDIQIPTNAFGVQEDKNSGNQYAGFRAYAPNGKASRSYIEAPIRSQLEKGKMYCVKFDVSLSDLSKYAVNYIGAYLPNKRYIQKNTGAIIEEPMVKDRANQVIKNMDDWQTICGTYIAKGGENHIVIGCFGLDDKLKTEKVKRPRGIVGTQNYEAYYYVDNIEVTEIRAKSQCECGAGQAPKPDIIYSKTVATTDDMTDSDIVRATDIYFASLKDDINAIAKRDLNNIVEILKKNPSMKLEVVGHCDNDEAKEGQVNSIYQNLGKQRADRVVEYLIEQGISQLRVVPATKENTMPANTRPTPMSIAQNRRVEFNVR